MQESVRQAYYEEWKAKDPEAVQRAWELVQANLVRIEANRLKREQEAEARRFKKAAKSIPAGKKAPSSAGLHTDAEKVIVHIIL